jgi:hypothetical protein
MERMQNLKAGNGGDAQRGCQGNNPYGKALLTVMAVLFAPPGTGRERIMAERRVAPRQKSFLRGCIYFNNRRSVLDCLVRDLTEDGARIIFSHAVNVPDIVELYIPQKEQTLRAHVKWRRGDDVGLDFTSGETAASPEEAELAKRVAQLEAEVSTLKKMVRQIKRELPNANDAEVA